MRHASVIMEWKSKKEGKRGNGNSESREYCSKKKIIYIALISSL